MCYTNLIAMLKFYIPFTTALHILQGASNKSNQSNKLIKLSNPVGYSSQSSQKCIALPNVTDPIVKLSIPTLKHLSRHGGFYKNYQTSLFSLSKLSVQRGQSSQVYNTASNTNNPTDYLPYSSQEAHSYYRKTL